jgi:hypothetical protein
VGTPSDTLLAALFVAAFICSSLSGFGLALAAAGFARESGWRERWGMWLPSIFGLSLIVGVISSVFLLVSGIN